MSTTTDERQAGGGDPRVVDHPRYSICIPNYNYGRYVGETVRTVLEQDGPSVEVRVVDNASTDDSVEVLRSIGDPRLTIRENQSNVGFAANLDRAVDGATGDRVILLSSDDLMQPGALRTYEEVIEKAWLDDASTIISSTLDVVNAEGTVVGKLGPPRWCWSADDLDPVLTEKIGLPIYRQDPEELLRRCMRNLRSPVWFASTSYPRALYDQVEGYRGQYLMCPDKVFHWRVIAAASTVIFIDAPLFGYRVHGGNQLSIERETAALKRIVDQYMISFSLDPSVPARAGVDPSTLAASFVREDIAKRAGAALMEQDKALAFRIVQFGIAAYPKLMRRDPFALAVRLAVALRPLTAPVLARFSSSTSKRYLRESNLARGRF